MTSRRVAVVTTEPVGRVMAGPAIRAWHIAEELRRDGLEVVLATVSDALDPPEGVPVRAVDEVGLRELESWCDVLVFHGGLLRLHPFLVDTEKPLVADVYDPFHLENLEQMRGIEADHRHGAIEHLVSVVNEQLDRADFLLCASERQRDFWLGSLASRGRANPATYDEDASLRSLIDVVPFGIDGAAPAASEAVLRGVVEGIEPDDLVLIWAGGVYNWFDPLTLVRAVDLVRHDLPQLRLFFLGMTHPNPAVPEMEMAGALRSLVADLGLQGRHVFFNEGWVPYSQRASYLLEADVGVSTHLEHLETAFSFRTRILDYIWATVPIVATAGDAFAELIERETLGLTVPAGDVDALEEALFRVLDDREFAAVCRKNLAAVRPQFAWSNVLRPLVEFCRTPRRAPDLVDPEMAAQLGAGQVVTPTPRGWRQDVRVALRHLRDGGWPLLASKAVSRVRHLLAGRA